MKTLPADVLDNLRAEARAAGRKAGVPRISYSLDDAATACGLSRTMLYEAIGRGALRSFTVGRRRLIWADDLRAWLERQAAEMPEPISIDKPIRRYRLSGAQ
jgi:excisionase family DNA binding protein